MFFLLWPPNFSDTLLASCLLNLRQSLGFCSPLIPLHLLCFLSCQSLFEAKTEPKPKNLQVSTYKPVYQCIYIYIYVYSIYIQNIQPVYIIKISYFNFTVMKKISILFLQRRVRRQVTDQKWRASVLCLNGIQISHCYGREHEVLLFSLAFVKVYDYMSLFPSLLLL